MKINLSTKISSLKLKNPVILASGILGETGESLLRVAKSGAGAVVTKSIGLEPREGYANPTVIELEHGLLNAIGLANAGINEYEKEVKIALHGKVPVIGSVFGKDEKEFAIVTKKMMHFGVNAIELNLSCPHTKGYGIEIGQDSYLVYEVTRTVKRHVKIPVLVKISPHADLVGCAKAVKDAKGDAVVAINTIRAMKIDVDMKIPVLSNKIGGYSGKAIKPIGIRCVYEIANAIDIPIIGCGGIMSGEDVIEYLMAGASAVQIGSAVHYRGIDAFKKICAEVKLWMKKNHYKKIDELVGCALEK
jgi:dihydroorotate dehydrogenase (NAD+) catalytic subunit